MLPVPVPDRLGTQEKHLLYSGHMRSCEGNVYQSGTSIAQAGTGVKITASCIINERALALQLAQTAAWPDDDASDIARG